MDLNSRSPLYRRTSVVMTTKRTVAWKWWWRRRSQCWLSYMTLPIIIPTIWKRSGPDNWCSARSQVVAFLFRCLVTIVMFEWASCFLLPHAVFKHSEVTETNVVCVKTFNISNGWNLFSSFLPPLAISCRCRRNISRDSMRTFYQWSDKHNGKTTANNHCQLSSSWMNLEWKYAAWLSVSLEIKARQKAAASGCFFQQFCFR